VLSAVLELRVEVLLVPLVPPALVPVTDAVDVRLGMMLVNGVSARLDPDIAGT
jgi:hypothetical protein